MNKLIPNLLLNSSLAGRSQTYEWLKTPPITFDSNPDMIGYVYAVDDINHDFALRLITQIIKR